MTEAKETPNLSHLALLPVKDVSADDPEAGEARMEAFANFFERKTKEMKQQQRKERMEAQQECLWTCAGLSLAVGAVVGFVLLIVYVA